MTMQSNTDDHPRQIIDKYWIVEARDTKNDEWYQFGGEHKYLKIAIFYRDTTVLYRARHRKARIVEITKYRKIVQPES